ncbi:MAG TPA: trehalase family glycosidase [Candidatus Saccharimonadales bacterium]|nr:trehalase family glycosidase [Candidatus Saccharimonadales bacterium]
MDTASKDDTKPELDILEEAKTVLARNDVGNYTVPAAGLYPHQWLWDSCFVAIGLRHLDIDRAQTEILSLLRGQWHNGMLPHNILSTNVHSRDRNIWRSWSNPYSPDDIATSGITQPPVLAEAVVRVGDRLKKAERRSWYKQVYPALLAHHQWLYAERDPHDEGLVLQIHPWETGLDNTPPWMQELHEHQLAVWITVLKKLNAGWLINLFRRDTKYVPAAERLNPIEALALFSTQRRLRRKSYDIDKVLSHSLFAIEDLTFNSIFIRANQHLKAIATLLKEKLPEELLASMAKTETALEQLWDPYSGQYYSRNFVTHNLLKEPSIAALMPLYAGTITKERADQLVRMLENQHMFGMNFPVPSVPANSPWFQPHAYWQGPTWVNTNWLIIDGLKRMGYADHAAALTESTIDMVTSAGCYEYFSPIDGSPAGVASFSWTAALTIDLLKS